MRSYYQAIYKKIDDAYPKMSKSHKKIADFIKVEFNRMPFLTAAEVAKLVGVSESTVVRFASSLGYAGFPGMQRAFQETAQNRLTTAQRFELSKDVRVEDDYIKQVMHADINNIQQTADNLDLDTLRHVVRAIRKSHKLYILGSRSSIILAEYITFYLNFMHDSVHLLSRGANDTYDEVVNVDQNDVLIVFSFPRYSNRTFEVVEFAKRQKATIIGITDSLNAPLVSYSDYTLTAKYDMSTFIDSFVAPMSLVNAIIFMLAADERAKLTEKFDLLETLWSLNDVYK